MGKFASWLVTGDAVDVRKFGALATGGDDQPGIQAALDFANAHGIPRVRLTPMGSATTYYLSAYTDPGGGVYRYHLVLRSGVTLEIPSGVTLLSSASNVGHFIVGGENLNDARSIQAVDVLEGTFSRGTHSITFATHSDAGSYSHGNRVFIRAGQTLTAGYGNPIGEYNIVDDADPITGVLTLLQPLANDYSLMDYPPGHPDAGSPAPYGVIRNPALLVGSGITGSGTIHNDNAAPTVPLIFGNHAVGFSWGGGQNVPLIMRSDHGAIMSLGMSDSIWENMELYCGASDFQGVSQDAGNHRWVMRNIRVEGVSAAPTAHFHEGCSGLVDGLTVIGTDPSAGGNLVSVRAYAHDVQFKSLVTDGAVTINIPNIYVDPTCERIDISAQDTNPNTSWPSVYVDGYDCSFDGSSTAQVHVTAGRGNALNGATV